MADTRVRISADQQEVLLELARKLGYSTSVEAICFGVASMGMQAILAGDYDTFYERLKLISTIPSAQFHAEIMKIRDKRVEQSKNKQKMLVQTTNDAIIESTPAFFEGVFLYQQPTAYSHLFKPGAAPDSQNALAVAPLVSSHKLELELKDDIVSVFNFTGVYNEQELALYFDFLRSVLIKHSGPVALMLENSNHAITVGFDPAYPDKWIFIDANKCRDKKIIEMRGVAQNEIASQVLSSLSAKDNAIFSTKIYGLKTQEESLKESLQQWKSQDSWMTLHEVSEEKTKYIDEFGSSWLFIAAEAGDIEAVRKLIARGGQVNLACADTGMTPLMIAAREGHLDVVKFLLSQGANINQTCHVSHLGSAHKRESFQGMTALSFATEKKHLDCVKVLLDHREINVSLSRKSDGATSFAFALHGGNQEIVTAFIDKGVDLNQPIKRGGVTPLHWAVVKGYPEIAESLLNAGAKLNQEITNDLPAIGTISREKRAKFMLLFKKFREPSVSKPSSSNS